MKTRYKDLVILSGLSVSVVIPITYLLQLNFSFQVWLTIFTKKEKTGKPINHQIIKSINKWQNYDPIMRVEEEYKAGPLFG